MTDTMRMPINVAARQGVSAVATQAAERRVVLTNHGHDVAVVDSAERLDESVRTMREAARLVTAQVAEGLLGEHKATLTLDDVCVRLGIEADMVRKRAQGMRTAG